MKFSKKSEYALRSMVVMATHRGSLQTIPKISAAASVPPKFLEQILLTLRNAGFLQSRRGAGGGYLMEKSPSSIRLVEIIDAVEKKSAARPMFQTNDAVDVFLAAVENEIQTRLEKTTLDDLMRLAQPADTANFEI